MAKAIVVDLYESGNVEESLVADYAWVAKDEIADYVTGDDEYLEYLGKLL